jgi:hypothetical protein
LPGRSRRRRYDTQVGDPGCGDTDKNENQIDGPWPAQRFISTGGQRWKLAGGGRRKPEGNVNET